VPVNLNRLILVTGVVAFTAAPSIAWEKDRELLVTLNIGQGGLPFVLVLPDTQPASSAYIRNGSEKIEIPKVSEESGRISLDFTHYDCGVELSASGKGDLTGFWKKRINNSDYAVVNLRAERFDGHRFKPILRVTEDFVKFAPAAGRWVVKFAADQESAVGVFRETGGKTIEGTFLTTTGDYRYLAGSYEYGQLRLSCFDGTHAFLVSANMQKDGTLKGDFWSGAKFHDTWAAVRDDKASLPDGFTLAHANSGVHLKDLKFSDLKGNPQSPGDPALLGKATIIDIFGSWCPNCHDAGDLLVDLEKKYGPRGFKVIGLAFENGDFGRDVRQVKRFLERHHAQYPVLIAGVRDRAKASAALPVIDGLKGYPTFLFVDAEGNIQSVYTGFYGPATGEDHRKMRAQFEAVIENLLSSRGK